MFEVVQRRANHRSSLAGPRTTGSELVGDFVVQSKACKCRVVAAHEQRTFRLSESDDEFGMKRAAEMNWNQRVVAACAARSRVFARESLRTETGIDHQDVVGAAPVQQTTKNDLLVERKIAAVRRHDRGLKAGLRKCFEQGERRSLTRQDMPPAPSARCSSGSATRQRRGLSSRGPAESEMLCRVEGLSRRGAALR